MNINDIIQKQIKFDRSHGFRLDFSDDSERYNQLSKDLIGLIGEIGEFANIVKKIQLMLDSSNNPNKETLMAFESSLREELVDSFIYLIRLAKLTGTEIETEYENKLRKNIEKYKDFHE